MAKRNDIDPVCKAHGCMQQDHFRTIRHTQRLLEDIRFSAIDLLAYLGPWIEDFEDDEPQVKAYEKLRSLL
jgi:hypothetical protein